MADIGEKIRKLREQKEMALKELAAQAKISIGFLADIESGRSNPSIKTLKRLAEALDTTPDYLLSGTTRDIPPTDLELEEIIEKIPNLRLYGEPMDERIKEDVKMALRIIY